MNWRLNFSQNKKNSKSFGAPADAQVLRYHLTSTSDAAAHSRHATWFICECLNIGYSINFTFARPFLFMQICGKKCKSKKSIM